MYTPLKTLVLRLVKAPTGPPDPPAGSHDSVEIFRASPRFLTYRLLGFYVLAVSSYLVPIAMVVAGAGEAERWLVVLGVAVALVLLVAQLLYYFTVRIDYDLRYYIVTDRSLRVREGAWVVKEKTITYANVQNLRVTQGPLMRMLGIWHLMVRTAGGRGGGEEGNEGASLHSVRVAGIVNAHDVRDLILDHLRRRGLDAGLGDMDDRGSRQEPSSLAESADVMAALQELRTATAALRATVDRG